MVTTEVRALSLMGRDGAGRELSEGSRYKRGYNVPASLRPAIKDAHRTRLGVTAGLAVIDAVSIAGMAIVAGLFFIWLHPWAAALAGVAAVIVIARQLRALENLVHEASHYNWSRHHRKVNDFLATAVAALPVGARIADYRAGHLRHHGAFGTRTDPDLLRYQALHLESLDRRSLPTFTSAVVRRLPAYQRGWFREIGVNPLVSLLPLGWAVLFIGIPATTLAGPQTAGPALAVWAVGYLVALPAIRFVAESSEHIYAGTSTVFDATISNLGWLQRHLFHPHNDGYHTVHHMWPGVPHHQLARLHRRLLSDDPSGYGDRLRYRTKVRQHPVRQGSAQKG